VPLGELVFRRLPVIERGELESVSIRSRSSSLALLLETLSVESPVESLLVRWSLEGVSKEKIEVPVVTSLEVLRLAISAWQCPAGGHAISTAA